jgi:hypothetical protein
MAKVNSIRVGKTVTVNIGNYENVRIETSVEMAIDTGDDVNAIRENAVKQVNAYISDEIDAVELKQRKATSKAQRFGV